MMEIGITPFGGRVMSQAMLATQGRARAIPEGSRVSKWPMYRDLCEAKSLLGLGDRPMAVVNALLSFYPEEELSAEHGLIVFPSNVALARRANGMTDATLRRHLASLVEAGLIIRRDSPNGKRYVRKGESKSSQEAFGFSLAPLLARAEEFHELAEQVRADRRAMHLMRERITLYRRDIFKLLEMAREESLPGDFDPLWDRYCALLEEAPRRHSKASLELLSGALASLFEDVHNQLKTLANDTKMSGNGAQNERHQYNSNTKILFDFEPAFEEARGDVETQTVRAEPAKGYPLSLVLDACPDISHYYPGGITHWRSFMATAAQVRGYLGISQSAYAAALDVLGQENTAIVIACMLQRSEHIRSAGGYLRALTEKAKLGQFSVGPMLMAAFKTSTIRPN